VPEIRSSSHFRRLARKAQNGSPKRPKIYHVLISTFQDYIYFCGIGQQGNCEIVDAMVTASLGEIFWNFFLVANILSVSAHLNGKRLKNFYFT